jgi:YD repeat-containing protein
VHYEHDVQGRLLAVVWPDGHSRRYHYDDPSLPYALTGLTDELGQRIGSYRYDEQGRVVETQRANGADRLQFAYGSDSSGAPQTTITDFASGSALSRTWRFVQQGRLLQPAGVSAPCALCGATAQAIEYDSAGLKTRTLQHDGSVVFYRHDEQGLEIERAAFSAAYASASTRPDLGLATAVTTTERDPASGLPTRIAEPGRLTTLAHSEQGITAVSTQASSDTTGAAGFDAPTSGPLRRTEYLYDSRALIKGISEYENGALTQRWALAYNALGDLTSLSDATRGLNAAITRYTDDGRVLQGITDQGVPIVLDYNPRGALTQITRGNRTVRFGYNPVGTLVRVRMPDGQGIDYVVDALQSVVDVKLNGASVTAQMLALGDYPASSGQDRIEGIRQALIRGVQGLLPSAHAQLVVLGGGRAPPPPVFDPRTDMLMSPISGPDQAIRALSEAIARACRCDPRQGFSAPTFTAVTFAHVFYGGHLLPMFSDKSHFAPTEKVGQALVDEVVARGGKGNVEGTRHVYNVKMGRIVGTRYDRASMSSDKHVTTEWITMIVEGNNCSSDWRLNEVVTMYPDKERP